jgi:putative inorganic carbon (HCO3(-)) transporter
MGAAERAESAAPRSVAEKVALAVLLAVVVLVPLTPVDLRVIGLRIADGGTVLLPLCAVAAYPFLRRLGAARLPALAVELPLVVFLLIAFVGIAFAQSRSTAILAWVRYALYLVLALVSAAVTRREANRRIVMWTFAGTASVAAILALLQPLRNAAADRVFAVAGGPAVRVFSTFVNPNFYSEYVVLAFAVCLALALRELGRLRWIAAAAAVVQLVVLVLTFTRGSWLALVLGAAVGAALSDPRWLWAVGGVVATFLAVPASRDRLSTLLSGGGSAGQRLTVWAHAIDLIRTFPVVGVGLGGYLDALVRLTGRAPSGSSGDILGAHDSFLQLAAETGVLGGLAFVWAALCACAAGVRYALVSDGDHPARRVNAALTVGVVAFVANALVSNSFQHPQAAVFVWVVIGLQAGNGEALRRLSGPRPLTGGPLGRIIFGHGAAGSSPDLEPWPTAQGA